MRTLEAVARDLTDLASGWGELDERAERILVTFAQIARAVDVEASGARAELPELHEHELSMARSIARDNATTIVGSWLTGRP